METQKNLRGKTALITGGGSGIGKASALELAARGARVALFDRRVADLRQAKREIVARKGICLTVAGDVASERAIARCMARIRREWGRLDIVFANAGINGVWTRLENLRTSEWDETIRINLRGTFLTVKGALPLLRQRGGSVIITSSVQGTRLFHNSGASPYATSKAAQLAFGRMIALELADHRIRVNTICPGAIRTNLGKNTEVRDVENLHLPIIVPKGAVPLTGGAPGSPEQVARLVAFLASDEASHITGTEVFIDGGESLLLG
ncbi:MAG: 3-ketoacyl-ACP reductase [Verrucomicrobia bacterium]|nr:3-ketoacyl-ACP reductase [Verrucomicrobiota bacterium]